MSRGALAPASGTRCMGKRVHQTPPPTTAQFVDPFHDRRALTPITGEERTILRTVNQKIAARPSLRAIVDYLFENTQALIPCDRIGLAFVDERGERVTSYYNRADYEPLYIDKDYTEVQLTKLDGMARKGRYLLGLVNEYLDLARVESGELTLDPTSRVNVNDQVIGEALELVAPQLEAHRVQLVTELPHAPLPLICCDPTLLRIVLVNLLDNAVKYGNEDGTIRLRAEVTSGREDNPARLKISVWNLGPASAQRRRTSCSGGSHASTTRPSRRVAARAWASTTRGASSSCTRDASPPTPSTASGRNSVLRYRRRPTARNRRLPNQGVTHDSSDRDGWVHRRGRHRRGAARGGHQGCRPRARDPRQGA